MRASRKLIALNLAVMAALLGSSGVAAQVDGPVATPRPEERPGVRTAVLRSELTDPAVNAMIEEAARFAHTEIGGRLNARRGDVPFRSELLPTRTDVVLEARELADRAEEDDAPINIMVVSGGDSTATSAFANSVPRTLFVEIDQPRPCLTTEGVRDPEGLCEGGLGIIPRNLLSVTFAVDEAAYLAGIVAASASRNDRLGIISGTPACPSCNRAINGFVRGAQSVNPEIDVEVAYLADAANYAAEGGEVAAFGDLAAARTFSRAFIDVHQPDVILPLAGAANRGIIEAVCESGDRLAVGMDFDVAAAYPNLADCILTSVVKDYEYAVREPIFAWANDAISSDWRLGLDDDRIIVTDEWTRRSLPGGLAERYAQAEQGILIGQIPTCPVRCEAPVDVAAIADTPAVPAGPVPEVEPEEEDDDGTSDVPEASPSPIGA